MFALVDLVHVKIIAKRFVCPKFVCHRYLSHGKDSLMMLPYLKVPEFVGHLLNEMYQ